MKKGESYTEQETRRRFESALRGAFKTPPVAMKDIPPKRAKAQRKRAAKKR